MRKRFDLQFIPMMKIFQSASFLNDWNVKKGYSKATIELAVCSQFFH
jgi:hypothetical protein